MIAISKISPDGSDDEEEVDDVDFVVTKAILNSNETPEQRQARWESMVEERREKGERTIKLVISLPKEATLLPPGGHEREELIGSVKSKIEGVVAPYQEVRVDEQIDHVTEKRTTSRSHTRTAWDTGAGISSNSINPVVRHTGAARGVGG